MVTITDRGLNCYDCDDDNDVHVKSNSVSTRRQCHCYIFTYLSNFVKIQANSVSVSEFQSIRHILVLSVDFRPDYCFVFCYSIFKCSCHRECLRDCHRVGFSFWSHGEWLLLNLWLSSSDEYSENNDFNVPHIFFDIVSRRDYVKIAFVKPNFDAIDFSKPNIVDQCITVTESFTNNNGSNLFRFIFCDT